MLEVPFGATKKYTKKGRPFGVPLYGLSRFSLIIKFAQTFLRRLFCPSPFPCALWEFSTWRWDTKWGSSSVAGWVSLSISASQSVDGSAEHDTLVVQGHNNGLLNLQRWEDWGATSTDRPTHRPPRFVQEEQGGC